MEGNVTQQKNTRTRGMSLSKRSASIKEVCMKFDANHRKSSFRTVNPAEKDVPVVQRYICVYIYTCAQIKVGIVLYVYHMTSKQQYAYQTNEPCSAVV